MNEKVISLIRPICPNVWAIELPTRPVFPAAVFEVETTAEEHWTGGGYDRHTVRVVVLASTLEVLKPIQEAIRSAFDKDPLSMGNSEIGDADYEADPKLYAGYILTQFRTRSH